MDYCISPHLQTLPSVVITNNKRLKDMDSRPADYLRHRLMRFATAIEETRDHFSELAAFGNYPACNPYYERAGIMRLLDSSKDETCSSGEYLQEYRRLEQQLNELERVRGTEYRRPLREELSAYTERYHSAVCQANTGMLTFENDHDIFYRDRIEVLLCELERDYDLREVKNLISLLDRNLFPAREKTGCEPPAPLVEPVVNLHLPLEMDKIRG